MKKVILFIAAVTIVVTLCGCASNQSESVVVEDQPSMFIMVEDGRFWNVYYHRDTKVMYVMSAGGYNCGTFTVLINSDGSPMIWEE